MPNFTGFVGIVHIVAAVLAIIELGFTAYLVTPFAGPYSPSVTDFMLFNSIWSLLVLFYVGLTPMYMTSIFHRLAATVLNVITAIFWFAGSVAYAAEWGSPRCVTGYCRVTEAAIAFGFFLWIAFTFLAVLDTIESLKRRGNHVNTKQSTDAYAGA